MLGGCIECPSGSRRPVSRPGPRCATHQRARKKLASTSRWAKHIRDTYGLTVDDYHAILQIQDGRCYICRRATGATKKLSVDHDHATGEIRGLLCTPCNRDVLGHLRDDIQAFERCIEYLTNPPARQALERKT